VDAGIKHAIGTVDAGIKHIIVTSTVLVALGLLMLLV
jgi:hypothetical protein